MVDPGQEQEKSITKGFSMFLKMFNRILNKIHSQILKKDVQQETEESRMDETVIIPHKDSESSQN